jgi:hypothetical protein
VARSTTCFPTCSAVRGETPNWASYAAIVMRVTGIGLHKLGTESGGAWTPVPVLSGVGTIVRQGCQSVDLSQMLEVSAQVGSALLGITPHSADDRSASGSPSAIEPRGERGTIPSRSLRLREVV